jgi:hypothetical protein
MPRIIRVFSRLPTAFRMAVNMMLRREDPGLVCRLGMDVKDPCFLVVDPDDGVRHDLILSAKPIVAATHPLLLVPLDDGGRAHLGHIRILAELAPRVSLPQQIPALIEFDLDGFQPYLIVIGQFALPVKMLLLVNQAFDLLQDGVIGRRFSHVNHLADSPLLFRS